MVPDARVFTTIAEWFPTSMHIQDIRFDLRFIDLPYQENQISVYWIYPNIDLPTYLAISSSPLMAPMPTFSYAKELTIIDKRPIQSWFEPPQILLSYWQWLHLLQSNTAFVNGEETNFFTIYQRMQPPSSVLVHDPSGAVKDILTKNPHHHPWTLISSIEKTYELKHLLLDSTRTLTQGIFIGLWLLELFIWSTRLHWIYQNHHPQWRWLLLLHLPMKRMWQTISIRTFLIGFVTLGIVQWLFIYLVDTWQFIPASTLVTMVVIGWVIYLVQQINRYVILHWYGHA
jgi:hypothetical protein